MGDPRELIGNFRAKFPGAYDDLSDEDLAGKLVTKFPGAYDADLAPLIAPPQGPPTLSGLAAQRKATGGNVYGGVPGPEPATNAPPYAETHPVTGPIVEPVQNMMAAVQRGIQQTPARTASIIRDPRQIAEVASGRLDNPLGEGVKDAASLAGGMMHAAYAPVTAPVEFAANAPLEAAGVPEPVRRILSGAAGMIAPGAAAAKLAPGGAMAHMFGVEAPEGAPLQRPTGGMEGTQGPLPKEEKIIGIFPSQAVAEGKAAAFDATKPEFEHAVRPIEVEGKPTRYTIVRTARTEPTPAELGVEPHVAAPEDPVAGGKEWSPFKLPPEELAKVKAGADETAAADAEKALRTAREARQVAQEVKAEGSGAAFKTAQGSEYQFENGSTVRTKSRHDGHSADDVGVKPRSESTVFLEPDAAREVGMWNTSSAAEKRLILRGDEVLLTSANVRTGARGLDGRFRFTREPEAGRSPLELWGSDEVGWTKNHPGNPITEISGGKVTHASDDGTPAIARAVGQQVEAPAAIERPRPVEVRAEASQAAPSELPKQMGVIAEAPGGRGAEAPTPPPEPVAAPQIDRFTKMEQDATAALADLRRNREGTVLGTLGGGAQDFAEELPYLAVIGAAKIGRGAVTFAQFSKSMLDDFPEHAEHIKEIWEAARAHAGLATEKAVETAPAVTAAANPLDSLQAAWKLPDGTVIPTGKHHETSALPSKFREDVGGSGVERGFVDRDGKWKSLIDAEGIARGKTVPELTLTEADAAPASDRVKAEAHTMGFDLDNIQAQIEASKRRISGQRGDLSLQRGLPDTAGEGPGLGDAASGGGENRPRQLRAPEGRDEGRLGVLRSDLSEGATEHVGPTPRPQGALDAAAGPGLTESVLKESISRNATKAAAELFESGAVKRDPERLISDQITELLSGEKIPLPEVEKILHRNGLTFTQFGEEMFRPAVRESAKRLQALSALSRKIRALEVAGGDAGGEIEKLRDLRRRVGNSGGGFWRRLDGIRRGMLVTQVTTSVRNFESQGIAAMMNALDETVQAGLQRVAKVEPKENALSILDGLDSLANIFRGTRDRKKIEAVLEAFPKEHDRLFGSYASDLAANAKTQGVVLRGADAVLGKAEDALEVLNYLNTSQEFLFRRGAFVSKLGQRVRARGGDLEKAFADAKGLKPEDVHAAVDHALKLTFAETPKTEFGRALVKVLSAPGISLITPFPRFMTNALKYQFAYSPLGFLKLLSTGERQAIAAGNMKVLSQATIGTGILGAAFLARKSDAAGEKWYEFKAGDKTIDIRPFNPFASYFFVADLLKRKQEHTLDKLDSSEILQGIASVNLRAGTGLSLIDHLADGLREVGNTEKIGRLAKQTAGEAVAGLLTPLGTIYDIAAHFDEDLQKNRDVKDEPFAAPIKRKIPLKSVQETMPEQESPTRGATPTRPNPLLRGLAGITTVEPKNAAEKELDRHQFDRKEILPGSGEPRFDRAVAKNLGPAVESVVGDLVQTDGYKELSYSTQALVLSRLVGRIRHVALKMAKAEEPDLFAKIRKDRLPTRLKSVLEEIDREEADEKAAPDAGDEPEQ